MRTESIAEFVQATAAAVAAARLLRLGLARRQRALFTFLLSNALSLFVLSSLPTNSALYFWVYIACNFLNPLIAVYVVREMFGLTFDAYPGIRSAGRWTTYGLIGIAFAASVVVSVMSWGGGRHGGSNLFYVEIVDRSVVMTLAVVILGILLFLSRYPLHLHRNTHVSTGFFSAVFLSEAAAMLIDNLSPRLYSYPTDLAQIAFGAVCFAA